MNAVVQALGLQRGDQGLPGERIARDRVEIRLPQVQPNEPRPLVAIDVPKAQDEPWPLVAGVRDDLLPALGPREHLQNEIERGVISRLLAKFCADTDGSQHTPNALTIARRG